MTTKEINLKIWEGNHVTILANQGEVDSRYIKVSFKNQDGNNINLTDKSVIFYAAKPDGTQIFNSCTIDEVNNIATVKVTSQMVSAPGILECEFQIFNSDNNLLKVNGFTIVVISKGDFTEAVESTSEFSALTESINEAKNFSNTALKSIKVNNTEIQKDANNSVNIITSDHNIPTFEQGTWTPALISWGVPLLSIPLRPHSENILKLAILFT